MHSLKFNLIYIYIFVTKIYGKEGKEWLLVLPREKYDSVFFLKMVIYQLVEPGGAKCKRAFIKQHPPSLNLMLSLTSKCSREMLGGGRTFELDAESF